MRASMSRMLVLSILFVAAIVGCSSAGEIPSSLIEIEERSEDVIDIAPTGQWESIESDVREIRSAWDQYEPTDAIDPSLIDALELSIKTLEAATAERAVDEIMQGANDVSAALFDIWERYSPATPIQVSRLDVIGRQVILDVNRNDTERARSQVELARRTFDELRSDEHLNDAGELVDRIDASIGVMGLALDNSDAPAVVDEARLFLELVDDLERLY